MTEFRTQVSYKLEPQGEEGTLPRTFSLRRRMERQARRRSGNWLLDGNSPYESPEEIAVLTRQQVAALIADAAESLAYEGM